MLQVDDVIIAEGRAPGGKGTARKLRRAGRTPAIAYGPKQGPRYLSLEPKNFVLQRRRFGRGHVYDVQANDGLQPKSFKCLIKEIQVDPVSREVQHVDLYAIDMTRPIRVEVPIELTGKAAGIIEGGMLSQVLRSVEVMCLPDRVPTKFSADVTPLKLGESLHLSDLKLPEGVKYTAHGDEAVATIAEPDSAPATEPAAATPAAGTTAPAAGAAAKTPAKAPDKK